MIETNQTYKEWVNLARGIGMLLVVLGHAIADCFDTGGGIAHYSFQLIYSFHMPVFFFISGYCSVKVFNLIDFREKGNYIKMRFCRLMIPYFVIALIYMPLDILLARFTSVSSEGNVWLDLLTGVNPDYQLWTLYALFLMAVVATVINRLPNVCLMVTAAVCFLANELIGTNITIISCFCREFVFFALGLELRRKNIAIDEKKWRVSITVLICFLVGYVFRNVIEIEGSTDFLFLVTGCSGIYLTIVAAKLLSNTGCIIKRFFNIIGTYSMDIYIMGNLPQVAARVLCFTLLSVPGIFGCMLSVTLGILLPLAASKFVVRRYQPTRRLILGIW